jgi:cell division protease FtsH
MRTESLTFDHVSTGAADDLVKATEIARSMVVRFGMDPKTWPGFL